MKKVYSPFITVLVFITTVLPSFGQWNFNTSQNTPICVAVGHQRDPRMESDGMGGAFIVWKDYRGGLPDVYVQHIDSNGVVQWTIDGIGACTNPSDQSTPSITTDMAGGIIVTWSDWRSGIERDLYAQRIDMNGNILWTPDGVIVTNQTQREHNERIVSDGAGGCIIAFEKQNGYWEIWAQRLNSAGVPQWAPGGIKLTTSISNMRNPKLQKDHSGGAYITWMDNRNGDYDVYVQRVSNNGTLLWGPSALGVTNVIDDQINPKMDPDPLTGGVYVCWVDDRSQVTSDIFCQRIDSLGNVMWVANGRAACTSPGNQSAVDIMSSSNSDGMIVTWKDKRNGAEDIYAQRFNKNGVVQWPLNGIQLTTSSLPQINPNISGDANGGAIITWQDSVSGSMWNIKAQRLDSLGNKLWGPSGVNVSNAIASQVGPKNISDGKGGSIFIWEDERSGTRDIYAHYIGADGSSIGIEEETNVSNLNVYPNPFVSNFQVKIDLFIQDELEFKLTNLMGEVVNNYSILTNEQNGSSSNILIDGSGLTPGIYFLTIQGSQTEKTIRLVKQ